MIVLNILLGIVFTILLMEIIVEKDVHRHRSFTIAFTAVTALIICANTIF